jgi:hypothetical protein
MKVWVYDPQVGGKKIPPDVQAALRQRLERYAAANYAGRYTQLDIRFRGALCYVDAYIEPERPTRAMLKSFGETEEEFLNRLRSCPTHLGRLRYFGNDRWTYGYYTYSHEHYEPAIFANGDWFGTPEDAFDIGATYLGGPTAAQDKPGEERK